MARPLREVVEPWLNHLVGVKLSANPSDEEIERAQETGVVWLQWDTYVDHAFEAMELLMLFSRIDYKEWKRMLTKFWPEPMKRWRAVMQGRRFRLGCLVHSKKLTAKNCERFLVGDVACIASDEYRRDRKILEATYTETCTVDDEDLVIPVRIQAQSHETGQEDPLPIFWRDALLLSSTQATRDSALAGAGGYKPRWPPLFRLVQADFKWDPWKWSRQDLLYARQIAACGVVVHPLALPRIRRSVLELQLYTTTLQLLLTVKGLASSSAASKCVSLQDDISPQICDCVFSAVLASQSVEQIRVADSFRFDGPPRTRLWQWIAAVAFSSAASGKVKQLRFSSSTLTMAEVSEVERVVQADDPLSVLFVGGRSHQSASASKFLLSRPPSEEANFRDDRLPVLKLNSPLSHLSMIEDSACRSEWCSVLLPGWGRAWAKRSDVSVLENPDDRLHEPLVPEATVELTIESVQSGHEAVLLALLHAVGRTLKKIKIIRHYPGYGDSEPVFTTEGLRQLFRACPSLRQLELPTIPPSLLEIIADSYRDGSCRVEHLAVEERCETGHQSFVNIFFEHLADPAHPMATHLTRLKLRCTLDDDSYAAASTMLQRNRNLQVLEIPKRASYYPFPHELASLDGEPMSIAVASLAIAKKLAFLSVVQANPDKSTHVSSDAIAGSAIQALDSDIITRIFQFAAKNYKRIVRVSVA